VDAVYTMLEFLYSGEYSVAPKTDSNMLITEKESRISPQGKL